MIKRHLDKIGAHTRRLAAAFLPERPISAHARRQPAQQTEARNAKRHRHKHLSARSEECRTGKRQNAACRLSELDQITRVTVGEGFEQPQHQSERKKADEQRRHNYFICSSSRIAPALRRADRSPSAFMPPAA